MKFKDQDCEKQFNESPIKLQEIVIFFDGLCQEMGKEAFVTRVLDGVSGDSGVHEAHRGVDCRDEHEGKFTFTVDQINYITTTINNLYPRPDGKLVCIHHSFAGGPMHLHFQVPYGWLSANEIMELKKGA